MTRRRPAWTGPGQQLGDRVELRLARMQLASIRGGPQAVPALIKLGEGLEPFSREDRRRLLTTLAAELAARAGRQGRRRSHPGTAHPPPSPRTCRCDSSSST